MGIARNASKTLIIFCSYSQMIRAFLTFLQKVGVFGSGRTADLRIIMGREFIKFEKLQV